MTRSFSPTTRAAVNVVQIVAWSGACGVADMLAVAFRDPPSLIEAGVVGSAVGIVVAIITISVAAFIPPRLLALSSFAFVWATGLVSWLSHSPFITALVAVPLYGLLVAFMAGFAATRDTERPGCCRTCGYDLTGTPGELCPECGEAAS